VVLTAARPRTSCGLRSCPWQENSPTIKARRKTMHSAKTHTHQNKNRVGAGVGRVVALEVGHDRELHGVQEVLRAEPAFHPVEVNEARKPTRRGPAPRCASRGEEARSFRRARLQEPTHGDGGSRARPAPLRQQSRAATSGP